MGFLGLSYGLVAVALLMIFLLPPRRRGVSGGRARGAPSPRPRQAPGRRWHRTGSPPPLARRPIVTAGKARRRWQPALHRNRSK
jgi:hypothetical protein